MKPFWSAAIVLAALSMTAGLADASKPYAGQDTRSIKALSADDVAAIEAGRGWGFAKPAELNGIPGPLHVLELTKELGLSADQVANVKAVFEKMRGAAQAAGRAFLRAEQALDAAFSSGKATPADVERLSERAGLARSRLRAVHLKAHLETAPLLTPHQIMLYARLRGYNGAATGHQGHQGHHGHGKH
jgi:Spy/CpxP family protein refolding chaperone